MNNELIQKAKAAKSPEEILELARENGMTDFTEENARTYFDTVKKRGELADSELENATGGGCAVKGHGQKMVLPINVCDHWMCEYCNGARMSLRPRSQYLDEKYLNLCDPERFDVDDKYYHLQECRYCYYCSYERGAWWCNNKIHYNE